MVFSHLGGIQNDPAAVGFARIVIRPDVVGDLTGSGEYAFQSSLP